MGMVVVFVVIFNFLGGCDLKDVFFWENLRLDFFFDVL